MGHKVLFDGNGSGIIQVVGLGLFVPAEKHNEVMQKWEQAQAERAALADQVAKLESEKESLVGMVTEKARIHISMNNSELRAEAGRKGFISGANWFWLNWVHKGINLVEDDKVNAAKEYAVKLQQGGE